MFKAIQILPFLLAFLGHLAAAEKFPFYLSPVSYDSAIPTFEQVVGHEWGEAVSSTEEIEHYLQELARASSKAVCVPYAESWEGRTLHHLIIASQENMGRLEQIRNGIQQIAKPDQYPSEATTLVESLPAIVWLLYGVHGNEISSPNAALLTAYHLVAAQDDEVVNEVLKNCVVIIDPLQNPDGRARFVSYLQQTQGRWPDEDSQAAEHNEIWPSGRPNHYLIDLNRDWFARTQPETRGRIETYLKWYPQVVVDFHEMDGDETYYFAPPAKPFNPELTKAQLEWLNRLGKNNARWFDRMQFDYFTREVFDSFYPGYGEGWPMFQGSIGMTYEQASTRGLVYRRKDQTILHFRQGVKHHFIAGIATLESVATHRRELLEYFHNYRRTALDGDQPDSIKEFVIVPGADPNRVTKMVNNLLAQGIQIRKAEHAFRNDSAFSYTDSSRRSVEFPAGTYLIPTTQPAGRLARTLLAQHTPMDDEFLQEQKQRLEKRLEPEFYDLTGWSVPLLFDVEFYVTEATSEVATKSIGEQIPLKGEINGGESRLAYLITWGTNSAIEALASMQQRGIRVFTSDRPFSIKGVDFPRGSLIIKVKNNPADLYEQLKKISIECGVIVYSSNTSWVDDGVNFGSRHVHRVKKPKVAMIYQMPTQPGSTGVIRFLLEQRFGYPVTLINSYQLSEVDLSPYNVLVLPDVQSKPLGYSSVFGEKGISKLRSWVDLGGTLVSIGDASKWLTEKDVGLLATETEDRLQAEKVGDQEDKASSSGSSPEEVDEELPVPTPGSILRVSLDTEHWLTSGYDEDTNVIVKGQRVFAPLTWDKGRNLAVYMQGEDLLASGFMWDEAKKQLAGKAYLMYQKLGRGHIIAFAEDPTFRAFLDGLDLLFMNGVSFGPSH